MIKETILNQNRRYGRYFLSTEADDEAPSYKANTKVIEVRPHTSRMDFTDGAIDSDEEIAPEESPEDVNTDTQVNDTMDSPEPEVTGTDVNQEPPTDMGEDDNTDFSTDPAEEPATDDGSEVQNTEPDPATGDTENPDVQDDGTQDMGDSTDISVNDNGTELTTDADDMGEDDNTDFTADAGTDDSTGGTSTPDANASGDTTKKGPGLEYDSTRKYALFLNYETLINALANYITKLENNISDDMNVNKIIKTAIVKLREIKDLCYEYMIMKFEVSSYIQSLLFYQNAIIMTQSVFDLLQKMNKYMKKPEK